MREDSVLAYSFSVIILPNTLSCFSNTNVKNKQLIEIIGPGIYIYIVFIKNIIKE